MSMLLRYTMSMGLTVNATEIHSVYVTEVDTVNDTELHNVNATEIHNYIIYRTDCQCY